VVVVFGASSGIGRDAALRFAARGARVVVAARGEEGLHSLVDEIRSQGGEATAVTAEVTDLQQVQAVAEEAVRRYGGIDTWVHAAAVALYATFDQTTSEEFRRVIEVNLIGQAHGAWAALPHLRRRGGGALIHITSVEARRSLAFHSAYAASKHGVKGFLEALRMELREEGLPVAVTEILPASINTPLFNKAKTKLGVQPMGLPPMYPVSLVSDAILHAAEHPVREFVVGSAGQMIVNGERLSPAMMDAALQFPAFHLQQTKEPKGPDSPNNLFAPVSGYDHTQGDFTGQSTSMTCSRAWQALANSPLALGVLALGLGAFFAMRSNATNGEGRGDGHREVHSIVPPPPPPRAEFTG